MNKNASILTFLSMLYLLGYIYAGYLTLCKLINTQVKKTK